MGCTVVKMLRRIHNSRRCRRALTEMLDNRENVAAIILCNRALAWESLSSGDIESALDYRREALWFQNRDRPSASLAMEMLRYAV